ncbi:RagB/SusD family nutrient uptake outer membrane protein [Sphingobacterium endophyticum]|uniref:RagB/SusD family nutrient uptake outer membrane protein n=1 Tax=Sphingobacterium endophyticum TaxID=2546448 RepID=UPI0012E2A6EF|nr:RagB/SusD family nutrient uptake outer membrane protein [Sphingobacterium endophyticum]
MKKSFKYIIGILALSLSISSCSDMLDKEPISNFSGQGFYKSASDAQAGVNGIYNSLQSLFRTNFAYWGEGRADNVTTRHSGDPFALQQNSLTPIINSARWENFYTLISRANYAIKYIPTVFESDDSALSNQLLGQARGLRGLAYFYLVRIWGDVPLILEPYESVDQELFVNRNTQAEVLKQAQEDLLFAAENCADSYNGDRNRVFLTKGAANAFLTQLAMWQKQYQDAVSYAEKVMDESQYSLVSINDWNSIFNKGASSESIFEIGYNEVQTNSLRVLYALGSDADYVPSNKFIASIEEGDLRKSLIYDVKEVQPRKVWKFFGVGFNDESADPSSNNIVLTRLADIMLLKAEAHAQLNQNEEALTLLNSIRKRAGLSTVDLEAAKNLYTDLPSAILHERSIELCFEGHRWFDLVRTDKAISTMKPINGLTDIRNLVWPLHENALLRNPKLQQNEFYK